MQYRKFIESRLKIVNKDGQTVPFTLNPIQSKFLAEDSSGRDIVLKARQQGFSSLVLGMFTADFLLTENSVNVVVADIADNAEALLARVKFFLKSYEDFTGVKVPLKYNSKYQLFNEALNSSYSIGTATNADFGRSRTITNLHLSEFAFYPDPERIKAGALQAVVPNGRVVIETTANGFNYFKTFWDDSKSDQTGFKANFYKASDFYPPDFLEQKKKELGRLYLQEYPETDIQAFLTSGDLFFDAESLQYYLSQVKGPITDYTQLVYV